MSDANSRADGFGAATPSQPESILAEANRLVNGDRKDTYEGTDQVIVDLWSAYLGIPLTVLDYASLMVLLKIARTKGKLHRDSWVDIAGYAEVGPRLFEAQQPAEPPSDPTQNYTFNGVTHFGQPEHDDDPGHMWLRGEPEPYAGAYDSSDGPPVELDEPEKPSIGTLFVDAEPRLTGWLNEVRKLCGLPREWSSLRNIPLDVQVTDNTGDIWSCRDHIVWGFEVPAGEEDRGVPWGPISNELDPSNWDGFAPFTEVLAVKKPEPRVWDYVSNDIPSDVSRVTDSNGHEWSREGAGGFEFLDPNDWLLEYVGPFTEVLEGTE